MKRTDLREDKYIKRTHAQIQAALEAIKAQLWWNAFVDEEHVTISVDEGVATLTGTVDTWSERLAATENTLEGSAVAVNNQLNVNYGGPEHRE